MEKLKLLSDKSLSELLEEVKYQTDLATIHGDGERHLTLVCLREAIHSEMGLRVAATVEQMLAGGAA